MTTESDRSRDESLEMQRTALNHFRYSAVAVHSYELESKKRYSASAFAALLSGSEGMRSLLPRHFSKSDAERTVPDIIMFAVELHRNSDHKAWRDNADCVEAICSTFEGLRLLRAFVLTFGYPVDDVLDLSNAEAMRYYEVAFMARPKKLDWETLGNLSRVDVDGSLLNNLLTDATVDEGTTR
jgi:hypothetical protein